MKPTTAEKRPLVSVIIDTYNYGRFIEESIDSVLNQTFPQKDLEIIVVDDGSTDDTPERVKKYGDKIKYIYKKNGGQGSALNAGFENAKGEIIAFLDADDYWYPDKLEHVVREFEKSESVDVVYNYMNVVDNERKTVGAFPDPKIEAEIRFESRPLQDYLNGIIPFCIPTSGVAVRADCFGKIVPIPEGFRLCADLYIELILPFYAREFAFIRKHLGDYRMHGSNIWTDKRLTQRIEEEIELNLLVIEHIDKSARKLGYDSTRLKNKINSIIAEKEILLYNVQGKKLKALRKAVFFSDPALQGSLPYRVFKKISMLASIIVPIPTYARLKQRYRDSFVFAVVHRFAR